MVAEHGECDPRSVPPMAEDEFPAGQTPPEDPEGEPTADTAGEVDHEDPDQFRGGEADPPRNPEEGYDDMDGLEV